MLSNFSHASEMAVGVAMSEKYWIDSMKFGPDIQGRQRMKFHADIHLPHRMNFTDFGDALTFPLAP